MNNTETEQRTQPETVQHEGENTQPERTFTQEDVNRIVRDRLAKERAKTPEISPEMQQRIADLNAKESRLSCREYLAESGYPVEMLDILETSDVNKFKEKTEKICEVMSRYSQRGTRPTPLYIADSNVGDSIAKAFERNAKHEPKGTGYRFP